MCIIMYSYIYSYVFIGKNSFFNLASKGLILPNRALVIYRFEVLNPDFCHVVNSITLG